MIAHLIGIALVWTFPTFTVGGGHLAIRHCRKRGSAKWLTSWLDDCPGG